jgi:DNA-binding HxlR family transcriptional regulator
MPRRADDTRARPEGRDRVGRIWTPAFIQTRTYLLVSVRKSEMKRDFSCGLDVALSVVGGKWKPLVLFHLGGGSRRFGELRRLVTGISEKVLIQQLKELEADGILSRTDYRELPPRVDYAMTAFGRTLAAALVPLCAWGDANRIQVQQMQRIQAGHEPLNRAPADI